MQTQRTIPFGYMPDGTLVEQITLGEGGMSCEILTYGGALRSLVVPDRQGNPVDVLLGMDSLEGYRQQDKFLGALVGRYANRIGGSRFSLGGQAVVLPANDGENHLHGGPNGFDKQVWTVEDQSDTHVTLSLFSPDGQQGYPGNLKVQVTYRLADGALHIGYRGESDRDTVCSLTNHAYFNLSGHQSGPVTGQFIQLHAARYTPARPGSIPTGAIVPVEGTPMDLRQPQPIGAHIDDPFPQLELARGYDHNWVVDGEAGTLRPAAKAWSEKTGICLEVLTTMPGVQFYTGNFLEGCPPGKGGTVYGNRWAFCLETQYFPDAPNCPQFPSPVLWAGEIYHHETVYRLSCAE